MNLNLNDLKNIDYALSVAVKSIKKYNKFDDYDVSTIELKELQCRIQEKIAELKEDED
jgi:hypothetical protein